MSQGDIHTSDRIVEIEIEGNVNHLCIYLFMYLCINMFICVFVWCLI